MATKKMFDLAVKVSEYTDRSGQKKGRWQNVGAVMQGDDGRQFVMLSRWFSPAGVPDLSGKSGESVLLSMFEPRQDGQAPAAAPQPPRDYPQGGGFGDDVPF